MNTNKPRSVHCLSTCNTENHSHPSLSAHSEIQDSSAGYSVISTSSTMTTISDATPIAYAHPYIVCNDTSSKALSLWTCIGAPQLYVTLEGEALTTPRLRDSCVVAPDRIVTQRVDGRGGSTILVHSLPDGQLLGTHALGQGAVHISRQGLIAKWDDKHGKCEVYSLAENGNLTVLKDLSSPEERVDCLFESHIPDSVYLTAESHIHSRVRYPDPTVYLTRLSSGLHRQANFGLVRETPDDVPDDTMNSMLVDATPVSSSAFVMAHVEQVCDFNEDHPKTVLRWIDSKTLALGWHTLINQKTEWLQYSAATNGVVAYGWMGIEQGTGVIVLDATTGAVLRAEPISRKPSGGGVHYDLTPAGDTLVVVFGDGRLAVTPLGAFVANGFVREGHSGALVTIPCPELDLSTPKNSKERRDKARNGTWNWIKRAFVADGVVIAVPDNRPGFAILRW
ncbi:hypothetical protein DFH06DRAFT_1464886 [Mycena polygramma]|nr:hypothetical protein DFH06DRAFT_1464886 [Mycena polygramma]